MQGFLRNIPKLFFGLNKPLRFSYKTLIDELKLTDICIKKILEKTSKAENRFLRLTVESGEGCAGFKYHFNFDEKIDEEIDFIYEKDGKKIFVVDDLTLKLVKGCVVDYEIEMIRSGFQVMQNPNADKSCSCKISFSPKSDLLS